VVALLLLAAARFDFPGLGHYDPFYDTGVYLESARMISRGYPAYERVFSSQPPLWLPLLRLSFFCFGETFLAGQLVVAAASLIILAAVILTVAQLQGRPSALLAAVFIMLSPTQLIWSRAVIAEAPSMAFAAAAVALAARYYRVRRPLWLVLSSVTITCSILIKLFGIYTVPAVLMLVIARWLDTQLDRRARLLGLARDLAVMLVTSAGAILAFASVTDPRLVWDQAVRFHLRARRLEASDADLWRNVLKYWRSDGLLWAIAPFSVICILGGWQGLAVFIWMLSTLIGLLQHRPVFPHHLIALVPPLAAAAARGF
jgi:4-amino-4-deoxy-L-arabinose transferase-like glycosyltransferase